MSDALLPATGPCDDVGFDDAPEGVLSAALESLRLVELPLVSIDSLLQALKHF